MVGELDAGNPHVQFDEGAQETCDSATRLCPTLPKPLASLPRRAGTPLEFGHLLANWRAEAHPTRWRGLQPAIGERGSPDKLKHVLQSSC